MLNVLEAKIFQYDFLEGHNVWENIRYWSSTQRNIVAIVATKPEFLVAKDEMLVALATVSVAISSPDFTNSEGVFSSKSALECVFLAKPPIFQGGYGATLCYNVLLKGSLLI